MSLRYRAVAPHLVQGLSACIVKKFNLCHTACLARGFHTARSLLHQTDVQLLLPSRQSLPLAGPPCNPWRQPSCSSLSQGNAANGPSGTAAQTRSMHSVPQGSQTDDKQQAAWILAALWRQPPKVGRHTVLNELLRGHVQHKPLAAASAPSHLQTSRRQQKSRTKSSTIAAEQIPGGIHATAKQVVKLVDKPKKRASALVPAKRSAKRQISTQAMAQLQARLCTILEEAAARPHWQSNAPGFLACLDDVKLLFQQIFSPANPKQKPEHCCSVEPTAVTLGQCLDNILPVVLLPQQAPAQNMVGVAEFLQDIMGMDGAQVFKCFHEEPSVLYLDVYNDLMPLQDFFDTLKWEPADYAPIIVRHPQILLLPLPQYQRNVGYLLGQGIPKSEILRMWDQRAGLLIEPLKALHSEVLALRNVNRPLQDLALPAHQRPAPLPEATRDHLKPGFACDPKVLPGNPSKNSNLSGAVSQIVGTPQAVYLYQHYLNAVRGYKGLYVTFRNQFSVRVPTRISTSGHIGLSHIGVYPTLLEAAKAHDTAMFKYWGTAGLAKLNFPADYAKHVESDRCLTP